MKAWTPRRLRATENCRAATRHMEMVVAIAAPARPKAGIRRMKRKTLWSQIKSPTISDGSFASPPCFMHELAPEFAAECADGPDAQTRIDEAASGASRTGFAEAFFRNLGLGWAADLLAAWPEPAAALSTDTQDVG